MLFFLGVEEIIISKIRILKYTKLRLSYREYKAKAVEVANSTRRKWGRGKREREKNRA